MSERNFMTLLRAKWAEGKFVCVGLDSDFGKIPDVLRGKHLGIQNTIVKFNAEIINATENFVCAYKLNLAFYEARMLEGYRALLATVREIHAVAPDVPVILDAKRADIGSTNEEYARALFEHLEADAVTVNPYLGGEALRPFLDRADKGIFVLCRTSNPGAGEFQDLEVTNRALPLYQCVAYRVATAWNKNNNCALVVGATRPQELAEVRRVVDDMPILIPGIGAQGGDLEATVKAGKNSQGQGIIVNASRSIIYASAEADFAEAAGRETQKLHDQIDRHLTTRK